LVLVRKFMGPKGLCRVESGRPTTFLIDPQSYIASRLQPVRYSL